MILLYLGSIPSSHPTMHFTSWPRGEADGCNPSHAGSNPVDVSNFRVWRSGNVPRLERGVLCPIQSTLTNSMPAYHSGSEIGRLPIYVRSIRTAGTNMRMAYGRQRRCQRSISQFDSGLPLQFLPRRWTDPRLLSAWCIGSNPIEATNIAASGWYGASYAPYESSILSRDSTPQ